MDFELYLHWIVLVVGMASFGYVMVFGAWHFLSIKMRLTKAIGWGELAQGYCILATLLFSILAAIGWLEDTRDWVQSVIRINIFLVPAITTHIMRRMAAPIVGATKDVMD